MFSTSVSAHNVLEKSSPAEGEVILEDIDRISLNFDTKIEKVVSIKIVDESGAEIAVNDILSTDNQTEGFISSALEDGNYTVVWKIIGADAHPIEGEYSFIMNKNKTVDLQTPSNTNEVKPEPESKENTEELETILSSNNIMYAAIIIMFLVATGTIIWLMRKGKNK